MTPKIILALVTSLLVSCVQEMATVGHLEPYGAFAGKPVARQLPAHTVARDQMKPAAMQKPLTAALLKQGRQQYDVHCALCHGLSGYGDGPVVARGFPVPPSFHEQRLREMPNAHFIDVVNNGFGKMYGFADRIGATDAWAIVAYVRALEISQRTNINSLAPSLRESIMRELP